MTATLPAPRGVFADDTTQPQPKTVLVELFTSQGCSSCPPAERILSELKNLGPASGILPIAFHVDYWDGIGWKDPFSSNAFTTRQSMYARRMRLQNVYTPQAVVDGVYEMVGSNRSQLNRAVKLRRGTAASFKMSVAVDTISEKKARVKVTIIPMNSGGKKWIYAATLIPEAITDVRSGENSGKSIPQVNIVRALADPLPFPGTQPAGAPFEVEFKNLPFHPGDHAAAWVQDHKTLAVEQAAWR